LSGARVAAPRTQLITSSSIASNAAGSGSSLGSSNGWLEDAVPEPASLTLAQFALLVVAHTIARRVRLIDSALMR
jgi:hypothetical protein